MRKYNTEVVLMPFQIQYIPCLEEERPYEKLVRRVRSPESVS